MTSNASGIKILLPDIPERVRDLLAFEVHRSPANLPLNIGTGTVALAWMAVGYTNSFTPADYSQPVTPNFFTPDLKPVNSNALQTFRDSRPRSLNFHGQFPAAEFFLTLSNFPPRKPLSFQAFDARTKRQLTGGYSTSSGKGGLKFGTTLKLWHQTPIELVFTFALGPLETRTFKPDDYREQTFPHGTVKPLLLLPHDVNSWGSGSHNGTNTLTLNWNRAEDTRKPESTFVFLFWPSASSFPLDIDFIGKDGKKLPSSGGGSSDRIKLASYYGTPEDLAEVRLQYYPNIHRVVFSLPELPGLPEQNRGLDNLFDTHIPYVRLQYEHDYMEVLRATLAAKSTFFSLTFPTGYFPKEYTNITPTHLLRDLATFAPKQAGRIVLNPDTNTLEQQPTFFQRLRKRIQEILR